MNGITFDTLAYSRKLQDAGMPQPQADAIARAQREMFKEVLEQKELATKSDIALLQKDMAELRAELKQDLADVRIELKQDIADVRAELKQDLADVRIELKQDIASTVAASERHLTNLLLGIAAALIAAIGVAVAILK